MLSFLALPALARSGHSGHGGQSALFLTCIFPRSGTVQGTGQLGMAGQLMAFAFCVRARASCVWSCGLSAEAVTPNPVRATARLHRIRVFILCFECWFESELIARFRHQRSGWREGQIDGEKSRARARAVPSHRPRRCVTQQTLLQNQFREGPGKGRTGIQGRPMDDDRRRRVLRGIRGRQPADHDAIPYRNFCHCRCNGDAQLQATRQTARRVPALLGGLRIIDARGTAACIARGHRSADLPAHPPKRARAGAKQPACAGRERAEQRQQLGAVSVHDFRAG